MKFFALTLLVISSGCYAQNKTANSSTFKGEHYALYTKCLSPITFCEITQQTYTSCGSVKNCYGLYVMPGDTFYINIEDKNQSEIISADISFGGYFPAMTNVIFQPIDNNCVPQQALQMVIPMSAVSGSSFQIVAQNTAYVNAPGLTPGVPEPFNIYVGGQQLAFTFALSDFTICLVVEQVSVREINSIKETQILYPNPSSGVVSLLNFNSMDCTLEIYDLLGDQVFKQKQTALNVIDLHELKNGVYMCKFINSDKLIASEKLILMK